MLKSLENCQSLGGFEVVVMDKLREQFPEKFTESGQMDWKWFEEEIRPKKFVYIRHDKNSISFTIQDGPIKEVGVNGCQVDTLLHAASVMINHFNQNIPCQHNTDALAHIEAAIKCLEDRKKDREQRGVEGTGQA